MRPYDTLKLAALSLAFSVEDEQMAPLKPMSAFRAGYKNAMTPIKMFHLNKTTLLFCIATDNHFFYGRRIYHHNGCN